MRIEIKKSWFEANWNKPNRMRRHINRYYRKISNVELIKTNAGKYKLPMPDDFSNLVNEKISMYEIQKRRLESMININFNGLINEDNKSSIIDTVFNGKRYWAEGIDDKGRRFISSTPPKSFFKKRQNSLG